MTSRKIYVTFIVALSILSAMLIAELVVVSVQNDKNKLSLENCYKSAIYQLNDSLDNLKVTTSKLMVANGDDRSELAMDAYRHAETAIACINRLPISEQATSDTVKFLNQVGDWCVCFDRAVENRAVTVQLERQAEQIFKVTSAIEDNFLRITEKLEKKGVYAAIGEHRVMPEDFQGLVLNMHHNSVEYPELIYDGPFSDNKTYEMKELSGMEAISEQQAASIAAQRFKLTDTRVSQTHGKTEVFVVEGSSDGREAVLCLSRIGGVPISYDKHRGVGAVRLSREDCEQRAEQYCDKMGWRNMTAVWYSGLDGIAHINLAPTVKDVIYYTSLIKVKVAMDDGEILGFERSGYVMNGLPKAVSPVIDEGTARSVVSSKLSVKSVRLAVIPLNQSQVLCYEINGEYKGLDYFVYVEARTGKEVNVLRVVDNKQGSLTM